MKSKSTAPSAARVARLVYMTPAQFARLQALSRRTKTSMAVFVREGLDLVLARHRRGA